MIKITERIDIPNQARSVNYVELAFDERRRGRLRTTTNEGIEVGLFIDRGKYLQHGDWLKAETGELFQIIAASEPVTNARADDSLQFAKACYHLGNRHVPLQIGDHWLRFQPDHVLEDLCKHFGLVVKIENAPFQPENGAYGEHKSHVHSHHHSTDEHHRVHRSK